jgi:glycerol-3-phosphate dehydrogenase
MRSKTLNNIRQNPATTVLVVGGGINGIGLFNDLAQQGIDVLLVEKGDFCSGASAASSHMAHGGLRYLENGEFRLVREALYERNLLLENAPHYVHPLPTTVPIFRWLSGIFNAPLKFVRLRDRPGERGALVIKIGLLFYDWFARKRQTMPRHRFSLRKSSLRHFPKLNPDVICTATYHDAWMSMPERIGLEIILDAEADAPNAQALNYVSFTSANADTVTLRDELTGESLDIKPQIVVNAAGPWIDMVNRSMNQDQRFIGGTKGSHLILDHPELREAIGGGEIFFENADGRIVLMLDYYDRVMIGTSDILIEDPDEARCTEDEVDYILGMIPKVFPALTVNRSHIVFRFTGVRPLPYSNASATSQISRDHSIRTIEAGNGLDFPVLSMIGGKWTTFRAFAEQAVDKILQRLNQTRRASTHNIPIGGGKDYPAPDAVAQWITDTASTTGINPAQLETLFERYGTRAQAIATFITAGDDAPLQQQPDYSQRELHFLAENEKIAHLDDFILRRSSLGMLGKVNHDLLVEVAAALAPGCGWTQEQAQQEINRTIDLLNDEHGMAITK